VFLVPETSRKRLPHLVGPLSWFHFTTRNPYLDRSRIDWGFNVVAVEDSQARPSNVPITACFSDFSTPLYQIICG